MDIDEEVVGRLEDWFIQTLEKDQFYIVGDIYDDKLDRFRNGTRMHTSVCEPQEIRRGLILTSKNNKYLLGKKRCNKRWGPQ